MPLNHERNHIDWGSQHGTDASGYQAQQSQLSRKCGVVHTKQFYLFQQNSTKLYEIKTVNFNGNKSLKKYKWKIYFGLFVYHTKCRNLDKSF
jgi:hypothetical protein